jgi:hypothetical protein
MEFNILRFWNLCKRDFFINLKSDIIMISLMGIIGGLFASTDGAAKQLLFSFMFFLIGFRIFIEYSTKKSRSQILLLPVSNLERYLVVLFRAFLFYPLCMLISIIAGSFIIACLYSLLRVGFEISTRMNDSLTIFGTFLDLIVEYYAVGALFFFGSIFYKKYAGLKMGLLIFGIVMFIAIIIGIIFMIIGFHNVWNMGMNDFSIPAYIENLIDVVVALFFFGLSYLRLTEEHA